jgi:hypothetical protein
VDEQVVQTGNPPSAQLPLQRDGYDRRTLPACLPRLRQDIVNIVGSGQCTEKAAKHRE